MKDTGHRVSGAAREKADATKVWGKRSVWEITPETLPPPIAGVRWPPSSDL